MYFIKVIHIFIFIKIFVGMLNFSNKMFWASVLTESYIAMVLFSIFITLIFIYLIFPLEEHNYIENFIKSLELYLDKKSLEIIVNNSIYLDLVKYIEEKKVEKDIENKSTMDIVYRNQILISIFYIIGFLVILNIILYYGLGVNILALNWKQYGIIALITTCLILLYELLFIYMCLGKYVILRINKILKILIGLSPY